jgi:hypothetical protein
MTMGRLVIINKVNVTSSRPEIISQNCLTVVMEHMEGTAHCQRIQQRKSMMERCLHRGTLTQIMQLWSSRGSVLAFGTQVCVFKPGRKCRIF